MSRPRFLADNDLNDHIVTGLLRREPAIEFKRAREVGLHNRPDPDVLAYAAYQISGKPAACVMSSGTMRLTVSTGTAKPIPALAPEGL